MAKPAIVSGAQLDGFTIGKCVHRGGMATLWTVTHPGIAVPLLMKVPRVSEGEAVTVVDIEGATLLVDVPRQGFSPPWSEDLGPAAKRPEAPE